MKITVKYTFEIPEKDVEETYYPGFIQSLKDGDLQTIKTLAIDCVHCSCSGGARKLENCPKEVEINYEQT